MFTSNLDYAIFLHLPVRRRRYFFSSDNKLLDFVKDSRITVGHIKVVILLAKEIISSSDAFLRGGENPPL